MTAGSRRIAVRSITAAVVWVALWGCAVKPLSTADQPIPLAAAASPQVVAAYHLVEDGKQQLALGQTGAAIATFQKALALAPSSPHANLALGEAKLRQADYRGALVYGDRVARLVGDDPEWLWRIALLRGQAYEGVGDRTRARAAYRDVLGVDPNNVEARAGLDRVAPE
ncbi:MAG: tetratricopeptide repeat protein [Nitrospirae bacterium]|nr:tetratricopeptide repeat protein [Nitrospirota bacterium]